MYRKVYADKISNDRERQFYNNNFICYSYQLCRVYQTNV